MHVAPLKAHDDVASHVAASPPAQAGMHVPEVTFHRQLLSVPQAAEVRWR